MGKKNKQSPKQLYVLIFIIALLGAGVYIVLAEPGFMPGAETSGTTSGSAETPYGESLEISLGGESETSGQANWFQRHPEALVSWFAYTDSSSQNVYTVDSVYKSQEQVSMSYSLSVTYSNVESIQATVMIKAIESGTPANNEVYTLANAKALSGVSPIDDSGSTAPSISTHLTAIGASVSGDTILYEVYCQVTATGSISGDTLTATIPYTQYGSLVYLRSSESSSANVTPSVSVTSVFDVALGLPEGTFLFMGCLAVIGYSVYVVADRVKR